MAKTVQINVRIEADLKHKAERVFKGLPFDVSIPNAESREAIEGALSGRKLHKVKNTDSLFKERREIG